MIRKLVAFIIFYQGCVFWLDDCSCSYLPPPSLLARHLLCGNIQLFLAVDPDSAGLRNSQLNTSDILVFL